MARVIRAMSGARFTALLDQLGLSQRGASRFMGINERTARYYASGASPVDPRTAMLLEIMVTYKITPEQALRLIGIDTEAVAEAAGPNAAPRYFIRRGQSRVRAAVLEERKDGRS